MPTLGRTMRHYKQLILTAVTVSLMLMAIAGVAVAGPLEDAEAAYARGDYETALRLWRQLADQDNAQAQNRLGEMYLNGLFQAFKGELVHQNCTEALRLLNIAANHGLAAAQFILADLYVRGYCVSSDLGKARKWRKAYESNAVPQIPVPSEITITRVETPLRKEGGAFVVPVLINGAITLDFTVDSGAADVSVPADVFSTLARTGTIRDSDIIGEQTYVLADGSTSRSVTFTIRSLKVGDRVVENVRGSVAPSRGSLLLGQSFLERFKSWSIDNTKHVLLLEAQ